MFDSGLAVGTLWHKRYGKKQHAFHYKLNMWLIDLQLTDDGSSTLFNHVVSIFYAFKTANYLRDDGSLSLIAKLHCRLKQLGAKTLGTEKIYLLGQLSNLKVYFSPLNLYLVFNEGICTYVLAEVANTPWNERYYYLLDQSLTTIITPKNFHVSPFMSMNQYYHWRFCFKENSIHYAIDSFEADKKIFSARYRCQLVPFTAKKFTGCVLKSPFNVYKILIGIYIEALFLWFKRVRFHPKTSPKINTVI